MACSCDVDHCASAAGCSVQKTTSLGGLRLWQCAKRGRRLGVLRKWLRQLLAPASLRDVVSICSHCLPIGVPAPSPALPCACRSIPIAGTREDGARGRGGGRLETTVHLPSASHPWINVKANDTKEICQSNEVAEMQMTLHTLTVGEAVMRLDLTGDAAMMFRNSVTAG